ncbi:MAG: glycosyltransferase family 10 domain-containing protein [Bacillota bacterium]
MHVGFYSFYGSLNKNSIFIDPSSPYGDDAWYPTVYLAEFLKSKGHSICTIDMEDNIEKFDAIIFRDFVSVEDFYFSRLIEKKYENLYLIINECDIMKWDNWDKNNHSYFKRVLTWHDGWVDNVKYFKFHNTVKLPSEIKFDPGPKNMLCTMIQSGNKLNFQPTSLVMERRDAIRWFEQNHPEDFDLYGHGWDNTFPSYKGPVKTKRNVLQKYRFSICYENARDIPGYITEKIFDCFFAGNVPVYWGASNIADYIPEDAFIDKRNFAGYDELYRYLKGMSDQEYTGYLDAIMRYVTSDCIYPFSHKGFADTIVEVLEIE